MWSTVAASALAAAGLLGATGCGDACIRDSDCPAAMTCSAAACVAPPTPDAGTSDAGGGVRLDGGPDAGARDPGEPDAGADDAATADAGEPDAGADDAATADAGEPDAGEPDAG